MNPAQRDPDCDDEAARLLPWFVNGSLAPADAQYVEQHLQACAVCRGDAAELTQLRAAMRSPGQVEHAPHGGLHKLMQRIDGVVATPAPRAAARHHGSSLLRWMTGAVVLQSVVLAVLGTMALRGHERDDAAFRTFTAAPAPPAAAALRVVFLPSLTLAELQLLLRSHGLAVVAGPSEAGLYTLALRDARATPDAHAAVLNSLRADARVRFAEPLGPGQAAP